MDRVNGADTTDIGGGRRGFRDENIPFGIAGTEVTADFLNSLQEEILAVIEDAGIVPDPDDMEQLLKALRFREDAHAPPFVPVLSIVVADPPASPDAGDAYVIAAGATGPWAGHAQRLAEWTGNRWRIIITPNGHMVGTANGKLWIKIAGDYVPGPQPFPPDAFGTLINDGTGVFMFAGRPLFTGPADPSPEDGINGALYLNLTTGTIWGPKIAGAWPGDPLPVPFYIKNLPDIAEPTMSTLIAASDGVDNGKITIMQISELIAASDEFNSLMFFYGSFR